MKKISVLTLVLLLLSSALFAEDAKVLPSMTSRIFAVPTYSFAMGAYDNEGTYQSFDDGSIKLFNLGFALEYGVTNWITAALKWIPGWTVLSDIQATTGRNNTNANGVADIFAGAKIQIAGERAPIRTFNMRLAVEPGVIIPLPGPDFPEEARRSASRLAATFANMDKHVFAAGARLYYDWIINDYFFLNFYNETIFYPFRQDLYKDAPAFSLVSASGKVDYKYRLSFEMEPVFTLPISREIDIYIGLPVNFRFSPAYDYYFDSPVALSPLLNVMHIDPQYSLNINPGLSIFFKTLPLPMEFKLQSGIPVWGRNTIARFDVSLQLRAYFAFY